MKNYVPNVLAENAETELTAAMSKMVLPTLKNFVNRATAIIQMNNTLLPIPVTYGNMRENKMPVTFQPQGGEMMSEWKSNAQECLDRLQIELLGESWYIVGPVNGNQANEIITDEIIKLYKSKSFLDKLKEFCGFEDGK